MVRTFTAGRTDADALATEPTLLEVLAAIQNIEIDIEQGANPDVVIMESGLSTPALVPATSQLLTAVYLVPVGKRLLIQGVTANGDGDGEFTLQVNGGVRVPWIWRNSWCEKGTTAAIEFWVEAGETVDYYVENKTTHGNTNNYQGAWWGHLITI